MKTLRIRIIAGIAGVAALAAAIVPGAVMAQVAPEEVPDNLKAAIEAEVEAQGFTYAGLCEEIDQSAHIGEYCAFVQSMDGNVAEVTYGRVLSDEIESVTFYNVNGAWQTTPGSVGVPSSEVPQELVDAIKAMLAARGETYAGFCAEIDGSQHIGETCIFVLELTANSAEISYGRVLSDEMTSEAFEKSGATWQLSTDENPGQPSPTPRPPATGNGTSDDGGSSFGEFATVAGLAAVAVAGLTGGVMALRRR